MRTLTALACFIVAALLAAPARAQTIELKLSHFLPPTHPIQRDVLEPWAEELAARTDGKVRVTIYPVGSAFGHVAKQMDQVRAGVVDIAMGLTGIPRGRLPRTSIIDLPFLVRSADAASRTLWALYPEYLAEEYQGLKVLALHAHNAGLIHTVDVPIERMEDLEGLRIRTPSRAISMMLRYLGASPVGLPPTQVYENLDKGVIDGNVFPWEAINGFKLYEVLNHHLDARVYTTSFYFVMNQRKYDSLPEPVRQAIDAISGATLVERFGPLWDEWDQPGLARAKQKGNRITTLSDAERARWRETLQPMIEAYLDELESQGVDNAREIYAEAKRLVARYE